MIRSLTRSAVVLLGAVALVGGLAGQGPAAAADEAPVVQTSGFQTYDHGGEHADGDGGRRCAAGHERQFQGETYCDQYASEHAGDPGGDEPAAPGGDEAAAPGGDEAAAHGGDHAAAPGDEASAPGDGGRRCTAGHEREFQGEKYCDQYYCAYGDDGYYYIEDHRYGSRCCPRRHYRHDRCDRYNYYDDYYYDRYYYDRYYYYYDRDRDHDGDNGHHRGDDGGGRGGGDRDGGGRGGGDGDGGGRGGGDGDGGGRGGGDGGGRGGDD